MLLGFKGTDLRDKTVMENFSEPYQVRKEIYGAKILIDIVGAHDGALNKFGTRIAEFYLLITIMSRTM